jgi:hypothetical protein
MTEKEPTINKLHRNRLRLLEGLDDLDQKTVARDFEHRTGHRFQCEPCLETGRSHSIRLEAEADEPAHPVVAILEEQGRLIPLCEDCYERLKDSTKAL